MTAATRLARVVVVPDPDADAQERDELVRRLRAEVAEQEFDLVADPAAGPVPDGAKAADPAGVDSLIIALAASGGVLTSLIAGLDTGDADIDGDGLVSVDDAHEYVRHRLAGQPQRQSPRKWEFDVQGRIVLARSAVRPRRSLRPRHRRPFCLRARGKPTTVRAYPWSAGRAGGPRSR
ncbi:hypothetical protein AB0M54_44400 [Actinoplanes sp. NPDC051470]|uniref:hypothetical protein n=1 Tax=Actinoplanes sp. NPDC051470 TaxID=3157224 RepID=UPI003421B129